MAEKKFCGAPFGTQTARFDVTGVHPNTKVPGTFTQIPYDKPSTMELSETLGPHHISSKVRKLDDCLRNIKKSLASAKEEMQNIAAISHDRNICLFNTIPSEVDDTFRSNPSQKHNINACMNTSQKQDNDACAMKHSMCHGDNTSLNAHTCITEDKECNGVNYKRSKNMLISKDVTNNQADEVPIPPSIIIQVSLTQSDNDQPTIAIERASEDELDPHYQVPVSDVIGISRTSVSSDKQRKSLSITSKSNLLKQDRSFVIPAPAIAPNVRHMREDIRNVIKKHTAQPGKPAKKLSKECEASQSKDLKAKTSEKTNMKKISATSAPYRSVSKPVTRSTSRPASKSSATPLAVKFSQVSGGKKSSDSSAGGRQSLRQKLQGAYAESCETLMRRKLGPGAYNTIVGGFSDKSVENRAAGPGWSRQLEVERLASLPHLLYKEQWEENKMLRRKLGPGSYEIKDFIQIGNEKPCSGRGICNNLAPRFEKSHASATPGPGTYGIGGVPQKALEQKDNQSTSTKGMLDKGDRKRTLPSVGSHLGPGTYRHKTCTEEMLNKVTSLKGPYKLYSGDRNKPITEGYLAAPQLADLGPGQYEIGSFVDELDNKEHKIHGKFGKMPQYPEVPTDRLFLFSQAHCNRRNVPGPGAYSIQELSKPSAVNSPGFLSSAKRDDKMSQKFFTRNFNPVGAGRYDVQKFDEAQDINGHTSVFKSKTGKPNLQMAKFLQERIRSKDVSVENRVVLNQPRRMTRSITVM